MNRCTLFFLVTWLAVTTALPPCYCPFNLAPVCGSDGVTYGNKCRLKCQNSMTPGITLVKHGECDEPKPCPCTGVDEPVCGSDGVTYSNKCTFNCISKPGAKIVFPGPCNPDPVTRSIRSCTCTRQFEPICGSDGVTFYNRCLFDCLREPETKIVSPGPCNPDPVTPSERSCTCTREYEPMCGSDGVTYSNKCVFDCKSEPGTVIVSPSPCSPDNTDTLFYSSP